MTESHCLYKTEVGKKTQFLRRDAQILTFMYQNVDQAIIFKVLFNTSPLFSSGVWRAQTRGGGRARWPRPLSGQLLLHARLSGPQRPGQDGPGRPRGQVRQQRVQQQEAETQDDIHQCAAGGAGESVPENPLSWCLRPGTAGHEDGADRGQGAGSLLTYTSRFILKKFLFF